MSRVFVVYGEPQGKGRPRVMRSGHAFTPGKTLSYEQEVKQAYVMEHGDKPLIDKETPVCVTILAEMTIPASAPKKRAAKMLTGSIRPTKKPDWDNIGKIVTDALNGLAWHDDAQVVDARVVKRYSERPHVTVIVDEIIA